MPVSHSDRRQPAALAKALGTIIPLHRWLLALSVLILVLAASPASAAGFPTCKPTSTPAFGTVTIDSIVSSTRSYSTNSTIEFECPESAIYDGALICTYIGENSITDRTGSTFYQRSARQLTRGHSGLVWRASFVPSAYSGKPVGMLKVEKNRKSSKVGSIKLNVDYLDRSSQSKVQPETYQARYELISETIINPGETICPLNPPYGDRINFTDFLLRAEVLPSCQLENKGQSATSFDSINFGTIGALSVANAGAGTISAKTNIDVRCTYETPYTLDLGNGENFKNDTRRMKNGDNFLAYQLFNETDTGTSSPWSKISRKGNEVRLVNTHTVEGQLTPISVAPAAGNYEDTIVVTLTF